MIARVLKYSFIILTCFVFQFSLSAQSSSKSLKKKRSQIDKKIRLTNSLLKKAKNEKKNALNQLVLIDKNIQFQEEKINTINQQLNEIEYSIESTNGSIGELENQITVLREEYKRLIITAYKNRDNNDKLLFVFSSKSFNEAFNRVKYLEESTRIRRQYVAKIKAKQAELEGQVTLLNSHRENQQIFLNDQTASKKKLEDDKGSRKLAIDKLKKDENKYKADLSKQKKKRNELTRAIEKAIRAELEASKKKSGGYSITPEMKALSSSFEANKGKLPWPVSRGILTGKFGKRPHENLAGVIVENNGVDISTNPGSEVRALFNGTVTAIIVVSGSGKSVIVSHGAYRTVYSNLKEVYVQKGDKVATKENIGVLLTDQASNETVSHVEIWKIGTSGISKQNPENWLYKK